MTVLDEVIEELYARHTVDAEAAQRARKEYEERRGKVHQDDELWEAWSAAFVEWYVVERVDASGMPPAVASLKDHANADVVRALITSQRSLFEVRVLAKDGKVELLDLLGGAEFEVRDRPLDGVEVGDVAELRLVGVRGHIRFGRTFVYHPKEARGAIVERARGMLAKGATRRDAIDQIAQLRVQVTRYKHMQPARVYELGSRILG